MMRYLSSCTIGNLKKFNYNTNKLCSLTQRLFHEEFSSQQQQQQQPSDKNDKNRKLLSGSKQTKYTIFKDEDSNVIYDVEEEKQRLAQEKHEIEPFDTVLDVCLERGIHGVFDIEDLIDVLKKENAIDIFVCLVPKQFKYVDYMCIVTGKSYRHMLAIAEFVRRVFKLKRYENDIIPKIEGEKSREWMALDLGNIALHIFSEDARKIYDLETLWSIGPEYDSEYNKPEDPLTELFEKNSIYLNVIKSKTN